MIPDVAIAMLVNSKHGVVDRRIFSDKDIYAQELEQVFRRCWLFVAHGSQIPKPNDFIANYMGKTPSSYHATPRANYILS